MDNRTVRPGVTIFKEKPFSYILGSKYRTQYCDYCFTKRDLLKCSSCKSIYYCDKTCQKHGWLIHKKECNLLKNAAPRIIPDAARLLHRLMKKMQAGGADVKSYYSENKYRKWSDLMSHHNELMKDTKRLDHVSTLYGLLVSISDEPLLPFNDILDIYGKMCINCFNICNEEFANIGTGVYLVLSMADHSCEPNSVATFEGTKIILRTVKEIPAFDWSSIRISYIDLLDSNKTRQEKLLETYYFLCDCEKCKTPEDLSAMFGMACPNKKCENTLDPKNLVNDKVVCELCNTVVNQKYIYEFNDAVAFTQLQMDNMKTVTYLGLCKACLKQQRNTFGTLNLQRIKILDAAFESSIDLKAYDEALLYGLDLIVAYKFYYPKFHPLTGLLHFKLFKLLLLKDIINEAVQHLKQAEIILKITHGTSSSVYQRMLPELNYYNTFTNLCPGDHPVEK